jgi:hypothetical protein
VVSERIFCKLGYDAVRMKTCRRSDYKQLPSAYASTWRNIMGVHCRHWLDYDSVALAVLVIGIGMIELLALSI